MRAHVAYVRALNPEDHVFRNIRSVAGRHQCYARATDLPHSGIMRHHEDGRSE